MKRLDFSVFSGSEEQRYGLIIDNYKTQRAEFNLENQYTFIWAPLVRPESGS
jgi:hypothetical protein